MIFADTQLAASIERAECRLLHDSAAAIRTRRPNSDLYIQPLAGGLAAFTGPGSPLNKVAGLGFGGPIDAAQLANIERVFHERGARVQIELSNLADPAIGAFLTRRGYQLIGYENVLGQRLPAAQIASAAAGITVRTAGSDAFTQWLDVVVAGFATPDTQGIPSHEEYDQTVIRSIVADMAAAPGFVHYLAYRDGEVAGGASMCIGEGLAQLCGAATLPEHRRRGVQTAVLAMRLADAAQRGCDLAVVTTLPGSKSHQNAQRHGFEVLYTRAVLVREAE
jgi:GNAT superfamily N-acetyltransferase